MILTLNDIDLEMTLIILIPWVGYSKRIWCPTARIINFTRAILILTLWHWYSNLKMYRHTKNEISMSRLSKVVAQTYRQTHTETNKQTVWTDFLPAYTGGNKWMMCVHIWAASHYLQSLTSVTMSRIFLMQCQLVAFLSIIGK